GSVGLFGNVQRVDRGDFLLFGVGRPGEAAALSGVAGGEYRARKRRKRWQDRGVAGTKRGPGSAGRRGRFWRVPAGNAAGKSSPVAGEFLGGRCTQWYV